MSDLIVVVVKNNYVIDRIVVDAENITDYVHPFPHDFIQVDEDLNIHIGDWYEASEQCFYRPITSMPPDWPTELDHLKPQS